MNRTDVILEHILKDCLDIQEFISGLTEDVFQQNKLVRNAVGMSLINIGELVKALPQEYRDAHPELPWRNIAGMRDLVAHKYHTLDMVAVWNVAKYRITEIISFIQEHKSTT